MEKLTKLCGAIIDVETTGLSPYYDEIVEFGIIVFDLNVSPFFIGGIADQYAGLREPSCTINPQASQVNGITFNTVRGKSLDSDKINLLLDRSDFIIAHNARFDKGFVEKLFLQVKLKPWYCSMNGIQWKNRGFRSKSLQNLLDNHNVNTARAHRALDDARACYKLLIQPDTNGIPYMRELLHNKPHYIPYGQQKAIKQISASLDT